MLQNAYGYKFANFCHVFLSIFDTNCLWALCSIASKWVLCYLWIVFAPLVYWALQGGLQNEARWIRTPRAIVFLETLGSPHSLSFHFFFLNKRWIINISSSWGWGQNKLMYWSSQRMAHEFLIETVIDTGVLAPPYTSSHLLSYTLIVLLTFLAKMCT